MNDSELAIPPDFTPHDSPSNFMRLMGPMYKKEAPNGTAIIALRVAEQHLNLHGIAHGGLVATLLDNAIGYNVSVALGSGIVTANLSIDYMASSRLNDWIEVDVTINKKGRRMCFAEGTLRKGDLVLARGTCIVVPTT